MPWWGNRLYVTEADIMAEAARGPDQREANIQMKDMIWGAVPATEWYPFHSDLCIS